VEAEADEIRYEGKYFIVIGTFREVICWGGAPEADITRG
jgi:hypothetical protein